MLSVSVGQHSDKGRRPLNQDFHGVATPDEPLRTTKGIAVALADGIGSSAVSQVASEFAVLALLDDYYCTSDAWSVRKSAACVLGATNAWLHARTRQGPHRDDRDRGYVCTLSALVVKGATAHVFHVGDTRVCRVDGDGLERLTEDHRVRVADGQSQLGRAVGFEPRIEIDYRALPVRAGDVFVLTSDGVHDHVDAAFVVGAIRAAADLDRAARAIVDEALRRGSDDNLTVQIVVVDALAEPGVDEIHRRSAVLPVPPLLDARATLDGYRIVREIHASHRSHLYLALDGERGTPVAIKTPSIDAAADPAALERFLLEEWVARRIDNAHVLRPCPARARSALYVVSEYVDGCTLAQWMTDNPRPDLDTVRGLVAQIAKGLQAFHRLEMLHQDLRPANVMIDRSGTAKIIDFGSTRVAGIAETAAGAAPEPILGTVQYTAPEYFLGEAGTERSDLYALAVVAYQLLAGRLPYGTAVARARTRKAQRALRYRSVLDDDREIPAWIDGALRKALHPDPLKRHETLSEFVHDLRHPNPAFLRARRAPLAERHPARFWQGVAAILAVAVVVLLYARYGAG